MEPKKTSPLAGRIEEIGFRHYTSSHIDRIILAVRKPETGEVAQFEGDRSGAGIRPVPGYAMVSQPVRVGTLQIGQIELHAASPSIRPAHLLTIAQSLQDEILDAVAA